MDWKKEIKKLCWDFVLPTETIKRIIKTTEEKYRNISTSDKNTLSDKNTFLYNQAHRLFLQEFCMAYEDY